MADPTLSFAKPGTYTAAAISNPAKWRWSIAPGCYFVVANAPNRFHRWMQRVFLGLHWERNPQ